MGPKQRPQLVVLVLAVALVVAVPCFADNHYEADKQRAYALFRDHRLEEAIPILEKLLGKKPEDRAVIELLATSLASYLVTLPEGSEDRREAALRSRQLAELAKQMGSELAMMDLILDSIPADGNVVISFSATTGRTARKTEMPSGPTSTAM